jgi:serine phosphatase RsbU (regulator of sigma subunit)
MVFPNAAHFGIEQSRSPGIRSYPQPFHSGVSRLARELFVGRFRTGDRLDLRRIADEYQIDFDLVLKTFAEFQSLGMVAISGDFTAVVYSPNPKEMQEAYEIRAAIEEIAGRAAAKTLKGNTAHLQQELDATRAAVQAGNLDAYTEHILNFHRIIVYAAQNDVVLRVWKTLAIELRIRAVVGKVVKELPELVEAHQSIVHALHHGRANEAGLLLRNLVLSFLEIFKRSDSKDSSEFRAIRRDIEGAKQVQQSFFPPPNISIPCIGSETFYQPAYGLGGDYYDILQLQDGRWGIAIGDVSGKGISAALIMASLHATLRSQAFHPHSDPSALIDQVNRLVHDSSPPDFFASLFYAEYEPSTRILEYVNAGHHPPIVIRSCNGQAQAFYLKATDVPIGILRGSKFPTATFQLQIDDLLVAFTDGITEVENRDCEMYGLSRLEPLLRSLSRTTSQQAIDRILEEVSTFADGQPQRDDITLFVMRVQPGCES